MGEFQEYRVKPHIWPIGPDFDKMKFKCPRCCREMVADGFSPIRRMEAAIRIRYEIRGILLHPLCNSCRKELKSCWVKHPKFSSSVHSYFSRLLSGSKGGALSRSISVTIDLDDVLELYFLQDGKCAMSGIEMMVQRKSPRFKDPLAASIDRIDSDGIYERTNIQLVCARVNIMKGDMHHNDMIDWCQRILKHQMRKEDELLKLVG